jgi:ketosteroid isomerase-like protein
MTSNEVEAAIIALERAMLDRWCNGDPHGIIDNAIDDVTYYDHVTQTRIDGIAALREHALQFVDKVDVPRYEMPNPKVRMDANTAILTFNWITYSRNGELTSRWNATEVFVRSDDQRWRYAHLHWAPIISTSR